MPARARLVDVLPPLLAQVAPKRGLVGAQVDDRGWRSAGSGRPGASRRPGAPGAGRRRGRADRPPRSRGRSERATRGRRLERRPSRTAGRERLDGRRGPGRCDGPARRVGEPPRHRPRSPDEDLGADPRLRAGFRDDAVSRPAVDGLDRWPTRSAGGTNRAPGLSTNRSQARVRRVGGRHDRTGRRKTSTMTPTIDGSSGIRKAADTSA